MKKNLALFSMGMIALGGFSGCASSQRKNERNPAEIRIVDPQVYQILGNTRVRTCIYKDTFNGVDTTITLHLDPKAIINRDDSANAYIPLAKTPRRDKTNAYFYDAFIQKSDLTSSVSVVFKSENASRVRFLAYATQVNLDNTRVGSYIVDQNGICTINLDNGFEFTLSLTLKELNLIDNGSYSRFTSP